VASALSCSSDTTAEAGAIAHPWSESTAPIRHPPRWYRLAIRPVIGNVLFRKMMPDPILALVGNFRYLPILQAIPSNFDFEKGSSISMMKPLSCIHGF
jgi:hypothetical protein